MVLALVCFLQSVSGSVFSLFPSLLLGHRGAKVCSPEMMSSCSIPIGFVFDVVVRSVTCKLFRAVIFVACTKVEFSFAQYCL